MGAKTKKVISENFSEKKKLGRPRLMHPELEKAMRYEKPYCDLRTLQNEDYESHAVTVLGLSPDNPPDSPFSWLGDFSKIEIGKSERRGYKKTILAELGRIENDKNLIEAATAICQRKPKAQEAVAMIRGWRLGRASTPVTLESTLQKAAESYKRKHPEITDNDVYNALCSLEDEYFEKATFGRQEKE